ncbi:dTDP-glucose 4,6-dehydratase [Novosphingobium sp.]|uniref:dTDP-glucose 4,6-dehydratase n=1 Tax=Novosphingobium sp. TaxID=1874826 RepID=UPI0035AF0C90
MNAKRILITGGAGFIGSALVRQLLATTEHEVLNLDALTYAAVPGSLAAVADHPRYRFVQGDICDPGLVRQLLTQFQPDIVTHLAAESHVDRSIDAPGQFITTNVVGTCNLLQQCLDYWQGLPAEARSGFRFHHISTDEVFGSLGPTGHFHEQSPYDPRSPYSASKAGADHLVRAWGHTYGLPVLLTNCSNNYGPFHYPEKLIPLTIIRALGEQDLPVYGDGQNIRDWLHVEDHVAALRLVFETGAPGETYAIGGNAERTNLAVVQAICDELDRLVPRSGGGTYRDLIGFVADRPGHDRRYAIDAAKITRELGWTPTVAFEQGIAATVRWYVENRAWWEPIMARRDPTRRLGTRT